ncbi:hypothetical protein ACRDNQ_06000 [Palleronia sp. KMU-117]|uniref:hypothetical protein n=1 Tax=Palleronia sp. KMU-117 TaxID=3434108 RepID=UPI003D75D778
MRPIKRISAIFLAIVLGIATLEVGDSFKVPGMHGYAGPAHAIVGRPLTPVSVAGVARRSVRRCAVGVYVC